MLVGRNACVPFSSGVFYVMCIDYCYSTFSRERVCVPKDEKNKNDERPSGSNLSNPRESDAAGNTNAENGPSKPNNSTRCLLKSASISGSRSYEKPSKEPEVLTISLHAQYGSSTTFLFQIKKKTTFLPFSFGLSGLFHGCKHAQLDDL